MAALNLALPSPFSLLTWHGFGNFFSVSRSNQASEEKQNTVSIAGEESDREDIRLFLQGQEQGFNRLVYRHQDRMYNLCYRMLGESGAAEEAAQETFMRAYKGLQSFRSESKFSTWIYRIAVNACLNVKETAQHRMSKDSSEWEDVQNTLEDPKDNPEADLERRRRDQQIQTGLRSLPEEFRIPILLRDIEGRSYEEIAEITDANVGTVRSRLHRGRDKLRLLLKDILL